MTLYVETSLPDQWEDLESECISSGGHLVSLDHYYLEEALARNTNLSSYWSGGNICSNSPGNNIRILSCSEKGFTVAN